ncbi:MAG: DUF882 domain-containing protein [Myxococcota bacterium]|nr:DUF882 domain-containing protein [Myxococcota bacterium]
MVPGILEIKLATTLMAGWMAAASPVPIPSQAVALLLEARVATPVEIKLYDENLRVNATVVVERDGTTDPVTKKQVAHLFRCRDTNRAHSISTKTLAMIADVADRYEGKTLEFVSAYRVRRGESRTSPHRAARAIDFRIRGVKLREVRDYLWRRYTEVGVGWYPEDQFIHIDSRPTLHDTSWTFLKGKNRYKPYWADVARRPVRTPAARAGS